MCLKYCFNDSTVPMLMQARRKKTFFLHWGEVRGKSASYMSSRFVAAFWLVYQSLLSFQWFTQNIMIFSIQILFINDKVMFKSYLWKQEINNIRLLAFSRQRFCFEHFYTHFLFLIFYIHISFTTIGVTNLYLCWDAMFPLFGWVILSEDEAYV